MNKICLVYPWFGKFNSYFDLWLESAMKNSNIDFLIYTDNTNVEFINKNFVLSTNIKLFASSLKDISNKISNLTGVGIELTKPYKLCDYKPIYCYIFDEIKQYDYWGFGDMDVILGDISHFIDLVTLNKYDVIGHVGHMQIIKNVSEINSLIFKTPPDVLKNVIFDTQKNYFFDERNYSRYNLYNSDRKLLLSNLYADVRPPSRKFGIKFYNFTFIGLEDKSNKSYFYYDREAGKLYCVYFKNKQMFKYELLYVHFQKRKMKNFVKKNDVNYIMLPNRFVECHRHTDPRQYKKFYILDFIQCEWSNRKKYLKRLVSKFLRKLKIGGERK